MPRVVAAHDALQLGKLADHVGEQIGLCQARRLVRLRRKRIAPQLRADRTCNRAHAFGPFALGAELVVIDHLRQARHARFERLLAVLIEKEFRVRQSRTHHAFVATHHRRRIRRADVAHDQEFVAELAGRIEQGKIFLVRLHGENQAFLRHVEIDGLELPGQHIGPFDQRGHFVEQGIVRDRRQVVTGSAGRRLQLLRNQGAPRLEAGDHRAVGFELLRVAVGVPEHDRIDRRLEAMAMGRAARRESERRNRHDLRAVQRNQPMGGTHEMHRGPAIVQLIAHPLGNRQSGDRVVERPLQPLRQRRTGHHAVHEQRFGLAVDPAPEAGRRFGTGTQARKLFQQRRRGGAGSVQADTDRHELLRLVLVGRLARYRSHVHCQPARRSEGGDDRIGGRQPLRLDPIRKGGRKCLAQCFQRLRRQFLDEQFDQQIPVGHHAVFFSSWATTSSAHALGAIGNPSRARLSR